VERLRAGLGVGGGVELELADDIVGIVDGAEDTVAADAETATIDRVAIERHLP
jgi:hypothetical protein